MRVLITGASGFIGKKVVEQALALGYSVCATSRLGQKISSHFYSVGVGAIDENTNWNNVLVDCEVVLHLAARAHIVNDFAENSLAEYRRVNVRATLNLANQAVRVGVRRFVFVSSIGVNGSETFGKPFSAEDRASPNSDYAISKFEAEQALMNLSAKTGLEVVIVRPPLVYGPNAPGNFGTLMRWLAIGLPLPLGSVCNKRSFIGLDNLTDFLILCLQHPAANGQTFLVSDGEDVSTTELLRLTACAMGKKVILFPIPIFILELCANLLGKHDLARRLLGSLQIDITKTRNLLGWSPRVSLNEGLKDTVKNFNL
jgi:nucleoside-diphosphate-sugar epimerase